MHDLPRQKLREIVAQYGQAVIEDPRRCKALLLDHCGEHRREVRVLVLAMEERVPAELQTPQPGAPLELLLSRLTKRLVDDCGLAEDVGRWAVESWTVTFKCPIYQN
ncbi:MAG: SH3 domain-containing protein, partial [Chloroflexi bacterium]|nr:SH3 domain-containing protein [Chloroflexota bacterium]